MNCLFSGEEGREEERVGGVSHLTRHIASAMAPIGPSVSVGGVKSMRQGKPAPEEGIRTEDAQGGGERERERGGRGGRGKTCNDKYGFRC